MARHRRFLQRPVSTGGLFGCTFIGWFRILYANRFAVDRKYRGRAVYLTACSLRNSFWRYREDGRYAEQIERVPVQPPLFVLGNWRSGTTHLHYLLSMDDRFAFPNTYQVLFPHSFLCTEDLPYRPLGLPVTRPLDNVKIGFEKPQEEEFALAACGLSFLVENSFPRTGGYYRRFLSLRDATDTERDAWKTAYMWFLRKLTFEHGRPLVLKSPANTSRIKLLLGLFPDARFVYIHRHPIKVLQSHMGAAGKGEVFWKLQHFENTLDKLIHDHTVLYNAFFEERGLIRPDNFCELAFEELRANPIQQLRTIYERLNLPSFDYVEPRLKGYLESIADYRKSELPEIPEEARGRLTRHWGRCFEEWGYDRQ